MAYFSLLHRLAHVRFQQGAYDQSHDVCRKCVELARRSDHWLPPPYQVSALILLPFPEFHDPIEATRVIASADPKVAPEVKALALLRLGKPAYGLAALPTCRGIDAKLVYAACLAALGRRDEAQNELTEAAWQLAEQPLPNPISLSLKHEVSELLAK